VPTFAAASWIRPAQAGNNHQSWVYVEKAADGSEGLDRGFRFDGMCGTDAGDTQAFGNQPGTWDYLNGFDRGSGYGFAIPQLYGELAYEDFSLNGGHSFTIIGYEVVPAPDNFFFSHAFKMYDSEPFTHAGALLRYSGLDMFDFYAGWTAGWDTGFNRSTVAATSWSPAADDNDARSVAGLPVDEGVIFGMDVIFTV